MKRLNQTGAVSLLSVLIFMTIITVIVTAYLRAVLDHQREATTYDLSTRAYYAAESGVQDAIRGLNANPTLRANGQSTCQPLQPSGSGDFGNNLGYTCQIINVSNTALSGNTENPATFRLALEPGVVNPLAEYLVNVKWSKRADPSSAGYSALVPRAAHTSDQLFPPQTAWVRNEAAIHPLLRSSLIYAPASGNRDSILQQAFFLNPVDDNGIASNNYTDATNFNSQLPTGSPTADGIVQDTRCFSNNATEIYPSGFDYAGFACKRGLRVRGADLATGLYLRLSSVYGSTDFEVTVNQLTGGNPGPDLTLTGAQAAIDVTGRADNVYRRVKQTVPIGNGYIIDTWPDAALVAGEGICKYFSIGNNAAQYNFGCNPTTPDYAN